MADLTPAQLAGQRIIYAYSGLTPPPELLRLIRRGEAAGVILYASNISTPQQTARTVRQLQASALASPIHGPPLLVMTDQEGGLVRRLPGPPYLTERRIGERTDGAALAAQEAGAAASALASAGINVDLAPVLDVYRSPGDFIDRYQRSYSNSPAKVAALGKAFIAGLQHGGVAATAKHFPGLGAASADENTDEEPVVLPVPLSQLRDTDERPYQAAIAADVRLVMMSWAIYPAVDPTRPAGLSPRVIKDELRGRLGFRGVTVTDSLGAGALAAYGSFRNRAVLAANAGTDLLLCSEPLPARNSPREGAEVLAALAAAIRSEHLSRSEAQAAAARVLTLRRTLRA